MHKAVVPKTRAIVATSGSGHGEVIANSHHGIVSAIGK